VAALRAALRHLGPHLAPYYQRFGLYFRVHGQKIGTEEVLEFIRLLRRHLRRPFILVLDRSSVDRSAVRWLRELLGWSWDGCHRTPPSSTR